MSGVQERPSTLPWPPVIFVASVALAVTLNWLVPLPWLSGPLSEFLFAIGWMVVAGALAIDLAAMRTMRAAKTTIMPHRGADHLVTSGPFSFTRNPIYLGHVLLMTGISLIAGNLWFLLVTPAMALTIRKLAIDGEERHLEARFGKRWRDYAKKVRRWI